MNNQDKLITIGITAFNEKDFLLDAWNSVVNQTDNRWEAIMILDGSAEGKTPVRAIALEKLEAEMKLYWDNVEDLAEQLFDARPEMDPLSVRFTELHQWVTELADFSDNPQDSSEGKLEAIQMAWLELYKEEQE